VSYIFSPPRRRRRGVWLLAVFSVAVVVIVLVTSLRSERRLLAAYIDTAQESATGASTAADEFLDVAERVVTVDRQEFVTTMSRIRSSVGASGTLVSGAEVPAEALPGHARLELALTSWLRGLDLFEGAVLAVADDPTDEVAAAVVAGALVELSVGDRAYEASVIELAALEGEADVEVPSYPVAVFAPTAGAPGVLEAARTATGLAVRTDVAVATVSFEPRALDETEAGVDILPFTDRLIVNITVTNQGNQSATAFDLRAALLSDRTGTGSSETETVERLAAAESTSLEFVFEVVPLVNYELVINLDPVPGEFDTENNVLIVPFVVNEAR